MNISTIQNLLWVGSLACAGYLGYVLYEFRLPENQAKLLRLENDFFRGALEEGIEVPEPEIHMEYDFPVVKRLFHEMSWSGEEPKAPVVPVETEERPTVVTVRPIADLLEVVYVRAAAFDPTLSQALVSYKDSGLARTAGDDNGMGELYVEDRLASPHDYAFVQDILPEGILFGFDDEDREAELVAPPVIEDGIRIVKAGPDGAILPVDAPRIGVLPDAPPYRPAETVAVGRNEYLIGTDDAREAGENYAALIAQVRHRRYRDPSTGQYSGIQIQDVPPGSFAAKHGLKSGDVIKSINGTPVSSSQEAIQFAKNNADTYSVWEIVIENKGAERTVTYEVPSE